MTRLRRIAFGFWLALALLAGQQAAMLHGLGHATEQFSQKNQFSQKKNSKHFPASCEKCFACAELSSAAGASIPAVAVVVADTPLHLARVDMAAPSAACLAYRSRAPPALL